MSGYVKSFIILILALLWSGCVTESVRIMVYPIDGGVNQYFIHPTEWKQGDVKELTVRPDFTYRDEPGRPVVCNISFFHTEAMPQEIGDVFFAGDGIVYPLREAALLLTRPDRNEYRITSLISIEDLTAAFKAQSLALHFTLAGREYRCEPEEAFFRFRDQFLSALSLD
jgi:hypothetical protein